MKAKEFALRWNQEHPDLHFYLTEFMDDITEVKVRFRAAKYDMDAVRWRQFKAVICSRSQKTMVVTSGQMFFGSGAVDIIANPISSVSDFEDVVVDTLEHLGSNVFPEYEKKRGE